MDAPGLLFFGFMQSGEFTNTAAQDPSVHLLSVADVLSTPGKTQRFDSSNPVVVKPTSQDLGPASTWDEHLCPISAVLA